ncbi:nitrate- and nitrite sensing domain-containing protein [Streptomyces sp. NPDC001941]|uniref:sensor histidine kinase n=1 Tax=Streptomyces sp. NPDC001941 TaxID=3154659 RepID=UPI00332D2FF1
MRFRGKSIRRKIVALLLVPLVSLSCLWGFATYLTGREANQLLEVSHILDKVGYPLEEAVRVVQKERRQSLVYLADPRESEALSALKRQRTETDRVIATVRASAHADGVRDDLDAQAARRLDSILERLDGLSALRRSVEDRSVGRSQALDFYNRLVDPVYTFLMGLHALENIDMDKQARALIGVVKARELLSREDAVIASSLVAKRFTSDEIRTVSELIASRKLLYEINLEVLPASERDVFEQYWRSPDTEPLRTAEEAVVAAGATSSPRAVTAERWQQAVGSVIEGLESEGTASGKRYEARVKPVAYNVLIKAGVAGILGFVALLLSVVISVRIGRDLVRDLTRLRKEAHEVSGVRLPSVMRRLAAGEQVDVETEAPHLEYERDEIGQVGQALNTLQRAAVEAAVKQADMRRGVSEVFVNLARRNQVLLHRQLTLLDTMERRTEDTEELADLFRLDHLTTRMRRHAEGLVILSGAAPSRQWRKPVQLMDVVRAAVAEVEDYERIEVRRLPRIGVGGPAVADLTHLIAELLENATVFSPPHTAVQVHGERVANGFTLEIHDRGLGIAPEALLEANLRLAETPEFELSDTDRLGLFVVSRLAQRQNVRVSLQPSPYGGTTAVVFIPAGLLTDAPDTQGTGIRLDAPEERRTPGPGPRRAALAQVPPSGLADPSVLDGPVELEAAGPLGPERGTELPVRGPLGLEPAEAKPVRGPLGLERGTEPPVRGPLGIEDGQETPVRNPLADIEATESERGGIFRARGSGRAHLAPAGSEQHQQADDARTGADGAVPLPRRRPPTLVADHGRRVDEPGRSHPEPERTGPRPAGDARGGGMFPSALVPEGLIPPGREPEAPVRDGEGPQGGSARGTESLIQGGRVHEIREGWTGNRRTVDDWPTGTRTGTAEGAPGGTPTDRTDTRAPSGDRTDTSPAAPSTAPTSPAGAPAWDAHAAAGQNALPPARTGSPAWPVPATGGPGAVPHRGSRTGRPEGDGTDAPGGPPDFGGLPRRVRQASLAPQLRQAAAEEARAAVRPGPDRADQDLERDADEVRDRMASLQRGWQRGRRQNAADNGKASADDTATAGPGESATARGTTPEGNGR